MICRKDVGDKYLVASSFETLPATVIGARNGAKEILKYFLQRTQYVRKEFRQLLEYFHQLPYLLIPNDWIFSRHTLRYTLSFYGNWFQQTQGNTTDTRE